MCKRGKHPLEKYQMVALPVVNTRPSGRMLSHGLCRPGRGGHPYQDACLSLKGSRWGFKSFQQQQSGLENSGCPEAQPGWGLVAEIGQYSASAVGGVEMVCSSRRAIQQ